MVWYCLAQVVLTKYLGHCRERPVELLEVLVFSAKGHRFESFMGKPETEKLCRPSHKRVPF